MYMVCRHFNLKTYSFLLYIYSTSHVRITWYLCCCSTYGSSSFTKNTIAISMYVVVCGGCPCTMLFKAREKQVCFLFTTFMDYINIYILGHE